MRHILKISFPALSYRTKILAALFLVSISTSCTSFENGANNLAEIYKENSPIQPKAIDGDQILSFGTSGLGPIDEFDIVGDSGGVKMQKSLLFPNKQIEKGLEFQRSEERRNANRYLVLR